MTITLPDELREPLERDAAAGGFGSVDEYVASLVARSVDPFADREPAFRTRDELQKLLDAGVASGPPVPGDAAFWAERRRVLADKLAGSADGVR
jgi:Arc/MetJ-type ribon-helix-helix transcriptional regulator